MEHGIVGMGAETAGVIGRLPSHLRQFVVDQGWHRYTPIDHAVWRYIMRQNVRYLRHHAHPSYLEGLEKTGIFIERIPSLEEMNQALGRIGWGAVTVDGFIPPAAFMEFQAHRVLVIAADIRQLEHIEYTPAPDIVHEAAGHAPIIADPTYAEYLRRFGEVGAKAISSRADYELYEAIRHLSILKEAPGVPQAEVDAAQRLVEERQANLGEPSEMARLSRLHWWTVEYGLIGTLDNPKIYGAGLLSSIGEARHCLTPAVAKLPYSLAAADVAFDITTMQPQLFVTPDFQHLLDVLEEFASTMAFRRGGLEGLARAQDSGAVATAQLSSGLEISGVVGEILEEDGQPCYLRFTGPTVLAHRGQQLPGHGKEYHRDGFGTPVGRLEGEAVPLESMGTDDLHRLGLEAGRHTTLQFASGVTVTGVVETLHRQDGQLLLVTFRGCTVRRGDRQLFSPDWGVFDMAVGERVVSVYSGAADKDAYEQPSLVPRERTIKVALDEPRRRLAQLYGQVRAVREGAQPQTTLAELLHQVQRHFPHDWLVPLEILEVASGTVGLEEVAAQARAHLHDLARTHPPVQRLIQQGLEALAGPASA
jgi:phenylalanine-4-hydroxylase